MATTISKLFVSAFEEELKQRGFRRKGSVYYRLHGEILQGVKVYLNPYEICFAAIPYWILPDDYCGTAPLVKGYWIENNISLNPSAMVGYYRKNDEKEVERNRLVMLHCLELAKQHILPKMDEAVDVQSYICKYMGKWANVPKEVENKCDIYLKAYDLVEKHPDILANNWRVPVVWGRHGTFRTDNIHLFAYAYLYKAFLDRSFDAAYQDILSKIESATNQYYEYDEDSPTQPVYRKTEEEIRVLREHFREETMNSHLVKLFKEKMLENDLDWIKGVYEERRNITLPRLKKELGIDISNL